MKKLLLAVLGIMSLAILANAQSDDLIFIHHSCGQNWLDNSLRDALIAKDYVDEVNEIYYGTVVAPDPGRPGSLGPTPGDNTDMYHWIFWFNDYLNHVLSHECATGINKIVMFKSCYPNSDIQEAGTEPGDPFDSYSTIANYKALYRHPSGSGNTYPYEGHTYQALEDIFAANPSTLFIPVTAPALVSTQTNKVHAKNARTFNNWLKGEWLTSYNTSHPGLNNVMVFDWFDVLANPDDGSATANMQKTAYRSDDPSHPNDVANAYSTTLFATNDPNFIDTAWTAFNGSQTPYDITMTVSPDGAGTTTPTVGRHSLTSPQGITATPAAGQVFSGWTTSAGLTAANPNSESTTLSFNQNGTVTANFVPIPATATLTMAVTPETGGTTDPAVGAHADQPTQTPINITATPSEGYQFVIWEGTGSITFGNAASASTTATILGNSSATATFALTPTTPFITCGSVLTVYTGDLHDSEGNPFPDDVFTYKPKAWGEYGIPEKSAAIGVSFNGTDRNYFYGEWKKKIALFSMSNYKAIPNYKSLTAALYLAEPGVQEDSLQIGINEKTKDVNRQIGYYTSGNAILRPPVINEVTDDANPAVVITNAQPGDTIYIAGYYFSTKNPTVWLEYPVVKNGVTTIKALKCKVQKDLINQYRDAKGKFVCMNPATGLSRMAVQLPAKLPADWDSSSPAAHDIVIDNGIGRAFFSFDVNPLP